MRIRSTKGFSLMEILVAAVIFALLMTALANLFFAAKRWLAYSRSKMAGAELGKYFLEPLQVNVRQNQWDASAPAPDYQSPNLLRKSASWTGAVQTLDGKQYTPTYTVDNIPGAASAADQARKVKVNIRWAED